ncbi:MAG: PaaR repeat-containing protein [Rhodospirillales bacterium]|nr:PaaR repeat-containing protein [Rhodospirillales bacterium]MBR9816343.1 PaaR repeat-containing protein [Rhodospirillales bacterium]
MPSVTLKGHSCTGHGCWPPRPSSQGDAKFTVGGIPVHCEGHGWAAHTCPAIPETHASVLASGAPRFTVGGKQLGRVGDPVACGSSVAQGHDSFTVGD